MFVAHGGRGTCRSAVRPETDVGDRALEDGGCRRRGDDLAGVPTHRADVLEHLVAAGTLGELAGDLLVDDFGFAYLGQADGLLRHRVIEAQAGVIDAVGIALLRAAHEADRLAFARRRRHRRESFLHEQVGLDGLD